MLSPGITRFRWRSFDGICSLILTEREILAYLASKASGLTLHKSSVLGPRELDGDGSTASWRLCDGGSGVGTAMSSGTASLSTADAGVAEMSGGLTLGTGIATDDSSGAVAI